MNNRRAYDIAFVGLKPGVHYFDYKVEDVFFLDYGPQDFDNCHAEVKVTLEKSRSLILLKFDVSGTVNVICDRCANTVTKDLWDEFNLVVKMVEDPEEMNEQEEDPDIFYIGFQESHLHFADWIFEFVCLSIPAQRYCGEDENGKSKCNQEVLKKLEQMKTNVTHIDSAGVWKDLDKLNLDDLNLDNLKGLEETELN